MADLLAQIGMVLLLDVVIPVVAVLFLFFVLGVFRPRRRRDQGK